MSKKGTASRYAKALGETLVKLRELKGLGLREHARQLVMSPATLSRIERGHECDLSTIAWISEKTGISVDKLLGLKNER